MTSRIFISYRREDSAGDAGRLADHLHRRFGAARVFLDIESIDPGTDFIEALRTSLEQTAAVLVVIGPRWMTLRTPDGRRRLDDPDDFVRLEVETALRRKIPVVPVLVQGATLPRAEDLPPSLAPLVTRQVAALDHAEFHSDAERLCDRLASTIERSDSEPHVFVRRWWAAGAAAVLLAALGAGGYYLLRSDGAAAGVTTESAERARRVEMLLGEANTQQRRGQFREALSTLARAREIAPSLEKVRNGQEDVAMEWMRTVHVDSGTSSFGEAIKPALAVVDAALPSATGVRRADLLAHSGWAAFLMWRDGNRQLDPAEWYEEALALDPHNPYANAMLAHWILFQHDDVGRAMPLFDTALRSGRATDAVRSLQWSGYRNASTPEGDAQLVRLADAMRRDGKSLTMREAQTLWGPYYTTARVGRERERQLLIDAVAPEDHLSTLAWAFDEYARADESRRLILRYYAALLHARAGRADRASNELQTLLRDLSGTSGSLRAAVEAALSELRRGR